MKRLDDSMPGIFGEVAEFLKSETIMKELQKGDRVQWNEHPQIKSKIVRIRRSRINNTKLYHLENGCRFQINEITKIKS